MWGPPVAAPAGACTCARVVCVELTQPLVSQGATGKASLAWNSMYVALDAEAANGFARLAGPRALRATKPPPASASSGSKRRMFNCFCGAPANTMQPHLEILSLTTGAWRKVTLPSGLSAIMVENLPKRWANGDDFWDQDREVRAPKAPCCLLLCLRLLSMQSSRARAAMGDPTAAPALSVSGDTPVVL